LLERLFATTVLLFNNVPMEIVSELLGHSNMNITQSYYGKVAKKKVSEEIKKLSGKKNIRLCYNSFDCILKTYKKEDSCT
jgi:integrase